MNTQAVELHDTIYLSKNPTRRWLHQVRRSWILAQVNGVKQTRGTLHTVLEIGPGGGEYLPLLSSVANQVVVTDINSEFLNHVQQKCSSLPNIQYLPDDITASQLERNSFDLILCSEVLEHIQDSIAPLKTIRSLLKDGGVCILTTPQRFSTIEVLAAAAFLPGILQILNLLYREPVTPMGHINVRTPRRMERELALAGLRIQDSAVLGFYWPGVAEFLGPWGLKLHQRLAGLLERGRLRGLLWTQCYRLTKAG